MDILVPAHKSPPRPGVVARSSRIGLQVALVVFAVAGILAAAELASVAFAGFQYGDGRLPGLAYYVAGILIVVGFGFAARAAFVRGHDHAARVALWIFAAVGFAAVIYWALFRG